jgi:hypothetical protein
MLKIQWELPLLETRWDSRWEMKWVSRWVEGWVLLHNVIHVDVPIFSIGILKIGRIVSHILLASRRGRA